MQITLTSEMLSIAHAGLAQLAAERTGDIAKWKELDGRFDSLTEAEMVEWDGLYRTAQYQAQRDREEERMSNAHVSEPFRTILNDFEGGAR